MVVVGGDCVSEDEVDDDVGGGVDWDPGYCVLARESRGDFAEVFGACYDLCLREGRCQLGVKVLSSKYDVQAFSWALGLT